MENTFDQIFVDKRYINGKRVTEEYVKKRLKSNMYLLEEEV